MEPQSETFFLVWRRFNSRKQRRNNPKLRYRTVRDAVTAARAMAKQHGGFFAVMECVTLFEPDETSEAGWRELTPREYLDRCAEATREHAENRRRKVQKRRETE